MIKRKKNRYATNPTHYTALEIEPLNVIDSWNLDFYLGNVIKYIARQQHKLRIHDYIGVKRDMKKALDYLERHVKKLDKVKLYDTNKIKD